MDGDRAFFFTAVAEQVFDLTSGFTQFLLLDG